MLCLIEISSYKNITLSQLAKSVSLSLSTVNGIIDRLKSKTLVSSEKSPVDKRKICINITDKGLSLVNQTPHLLHDLLLRGLSELNQLELTTIALSLKKIVNILEIDAIDAAPALAGELDIPQKNGGNHH